MKTRILEIIDKWEEFDIPEDEDKHSMGIEPLLGRLEIIAGSLLQYISEKKKRREREELQVCFEESENREQMKNHEVAEPHLYTSGRDLIFSHEQLDQIELDEPSDTKVIEVRPTKKKKQPHKALDLVKLRKHNMNLFDETLHSAKSKPGNGQSSRNMSTTANLFSGAVSRNRVTDKFDFTGFNYKKSGILNKSKH